MLFKYQIDLLCRDEQPPVDHCEVGIVEGNNYTEAVENINQYYVGNSDNEVYRLEIEQVDNIVPLEELC